jgi:NADH dehydrogenase
MKQQVVIIGGGFAGVKLAQKLDSDLFDVLLIDRQNHHQFQPLFYQVATAVIEPSSISFPLRHIFKKKQNVRIRLADVLEVLSEQKTVVTSVGNFSYDLLILATGCRTNFFGNERIEKAAFELKTTNNALSIRNHVLQMFEDIISMDEKEREPYYSIVIVGAGPTGVELAGAFSEIKNYILPKDYPDFDFSKLQVTLVEGSEFPLNNMSLKAKTKALAYLQKMGVNVLTKTIVKDFSDNTITLSDGQEIKTKTLIWAAGVIGNKIEGLKDAKYTPSNRIEVDRQNQVLGYESIYALGDLALMKTEKYEKGHPQVANVAINQAGLLAKNLKRKSQGKTLLSYEYKDMGSMATVGRNKAVVDLPRFKFTGYFAWLVWMFLHLMLILTVRNKLIIFINWVWAYFTKNTSLRLIIKPTKKY